LNPAHEVSLALDIGRPRFKVTSLNSPSWVELVLVPRNVPDDAAWIGLERAQSPVGALELLGMGVTLMLDQPAINEVGSS
jgi:hypothetical protein